MNFIKLLQDACVFDPRLTPHHFNLLISKEFILPVRQVQNITYDKFLNMVVRIAEFKNPKKYNANPKKALLNLICQNFIPLIDKIEFSVVLDKDNNRMRKLYTISEASMKKIIFDEDVKAIFRDINPLLSQIY